MATARRRLLVVERIYERFAGYACPANLWVCEQCGAEWSAEDIRATPLRSLSLAQLVAVHVMSLDDDGLRHFFPRLMELMLHTASPVFDFRLADVKDRLPAWQREESAAVRELADAVWSELLGGFPLALGYFSDCPSALDFLDWCALPLTAHLDSLLTVDSLPAARHLADLIDTVFTRTDPFESASKATVLHWLTDPAIGDRLQEAFFAADSEEAARQLSAAHELWAVCRPK
ncbi:MAG TPA: hypothetical protein VN888_16705 [Mycobacterium sp.]|nr:hypothetical protein [Mycobacterium sp.]